MTTKAARMWTEPERRHYAVPEKFSVHHSDPQGMFKIQVVTIGGSPVVHYTTVEDMELLYEYLKKELGK